MLSLLLTAFAGICTVVLPVTGASIYLTETRKK